MRSIGKFAYAAILTLEYFRRTADPRCRRGCARYFYAFPRSALPEVGASGGRLQILG